MNRPTLVLLALALSSLSSLPAQEGATSSERLGKVHFPVSCAPAAQRQFDRAVALLHSFWYPQSLKAFTKVTTTDPSCAMAYWGIAMNRRNNPLVGAPDRTILQDGLAALGKAKAIGARTQRERDYITALETYYKDGEQLDYRTRVLAYEAAMEQLSARYPEDGEAAIFYALALNEAATALPPDKNYTRQLKAGGILEKVLAQQPEHPGVLHYLIHSYDYPPLADRGLAAARRYGVVAPSSPHALHMPSHTYSMLGMWQESINANRAALNVARGYAHAMDFMMYAYLQGAQDGEAKRLVEQSAALRATQGALAISPTGTVLGGYTALAAIPARYALERGAWAEASTLDLHPTTPVADAITHFARGMGRARNNDLAGARSEIAQLQQIKDSLMQSRQDYWAEQTDIQLSAVSAWVAYVEGNNVEALRLMRSTAAREDASEKHIAMENRLWPMREILGDLLLAMREPAQALAEYETSLQVARNRYRALYGAAQAAEQLGNREAARSYYERLVNLCNHAAPERHELAEARRYLARE